MGGNDSYGKEDRQSARQYHAINFTGFSRDGRVMAVSKTLPAFTDRLFGGKTPLEPGRNKAGRDGGSGVEVEDCLVLGSIEISASRLLSDLLPPCTYMRSCLYTCSHCVYIPLPETENRYSHLLTTAVLELL